MAVIVANQFTGTHQRFWHSLHGTSSRLVLEPVGGDLLGVLPSIRESRLCFPEFADAGRLVPAASTAAVTLPVGAMIRTEAMATGTVELALFRKKGVSTPLAAPRRLAKNSSISISGVQRNRVQNGGRETLPTSVLQLTQFVEGPKERPFQVPFVAGQLA